MTPQARPGAAEAGTGILDQWQCFERLRGTNVNDFIANVHRRLKSGERPSYATELASVRYVKRASAGVDTLLHCLAIVEVMRTLPDDEQIETLSLGAGTGDGSLDVRTTHRIVEVMLSSFSGRDSVRKHRIGRCCYKLACDRSTRRKELWVMSERDRDRARAFMQGKATFRCNPRLLEKEKVDAETRGWHTIGQLYATVPIEVLAVETLLGLAP